MRRLLSLCIICFGLLTASAQWVRADLPIYAGTSYPGIVYEYKGGTEWEAISPELGEAVLSLTEYEGKLYAGTASLYYDGYTIIGRVYRYDGGGVWVMVGQDMDWGVLSMAVYNNRLYVGTASDGGNIYRYEGNGVWQMVLDYWYDWVCRTDSTAMWVGDDDFLHLAFYVDHSEEERTFASIMRYDGSQVQPVAEFNVMRVFDLSQQGTGLFAAAYGCVDPPTCDKRAGRLYRSPDEIHWSFAFDHAEYELWAMEQFRGRLYLGYDDGILSRTDSGGEPEGVWTAPHGIISMAADGNEMLYFGTGAEASWGGSGSFGGVVYAYDGLSDPAPISTNLGGGIQCLYHPHTFPDIRAEHWAFKEIEACCAGGVTGGYTNGRYRPRVPITRDQMAVFIARALRGGDENVPEPTGEPTFPDVPATHWAYKHIEYACSFGVVQGYETGLYGPADPLTRDQMAVFIARALCGGEDNVPDPACSTEPFWDVPCSYWARPHIQYVLLEGVTQGYPDGGYHPKQVCTRAEMAVFMARAFHLSM